MDVIARHQAQALAVTTAGDAAALHCHTKQGTIVITLPLSVFIAAARGEKDANGQPFSAPATSRQAVFEADAEALPPKTKGLPRMTADLKERIQQAAAFYIGQRAISGAEVARRYGITAHNLWNEVGRIRNSAGGPVLKPSGKIG